MDRIRIVGGQKLNGTIRISGAKNAALPLMIASLLTDETLTLENLPRLADVSLLVRILGNHGVDYTINGKRPGEEPTAGPDRPSPGRVDRRHHRALRPRLQDAGELLGDRAAARPHGRGAGLAAGRLRHRHAAGRPAAHGAGTARRRRSRSRPATWSPRRRSGLQGRRDRLPQGDGRRHPHGPDGRRAGRRAPR